MIILKGACANISPDRRTPMRATLTVEIIESRPHLSFVTCLGCDESWTTTSIASLSVSDADLALMQAGIQP